MVDDYGIQLSGRQRALHEWLTGLDAQLGQMYLGIHAALRADGNPDHLPQACHGARELMEKLPRLAGPSRLAGDSLKMRARNLDTAVRAFEERPGKTFRLLAATAVDEELTKVLRVLHEFVEWFRSHVPPAREEARTVLRLLEQSGRMLPEHLTRQNENVWRDVR